jgi:hypothetical protein
VHVVGLWNSILVTVHGLSNIKQGEGKSLVNSRGKTNVWGYQNILAGMVKRKIGRYSFCHLKIIARWKPLRYGAW